jgi:hypothetical protein
MCCNFVIEPKVGVDERHTSVSSPSIPVPDRGSEKINVRFSDSGSAADDQLRDPGLVCPG